MALFSRTPKKKVASKEKPSRAARAGASVAVAASDVSWVVLEPRITEKATHVAGSNVYVFNVHPRANKTLVASAIARSFSVKPMKVRVVNVSGKDKRSARTGRIGRTADFKKAYVYLKKGDSITIA